MWSAPLLATAAAGLRAAQAGRQVRLRGRQPWRQAEAIVPVGQAAEPTGQPSGTATAKPCRQLSDAGNTLTAALTAALAVRLARLTGLAAWPAAG